MMMGKDVQLKGVWRADSFEPRLGEGKWQVSYTLKDTKGGLGGEVERKKKNRRLKNTIYL